MKEPTKVKANSSKEHTAKAPKVVAKGWYYDAYTSISIQRNFFILLFLIATAVIALSLVTIRYLKNTQTIEPFVIEIEKKSGVPTVIRPLDVKEYSANRAVVEALIIQYIKAREGYNYYSFNDNYSNLVRIMSSSSVYHQQYQPIFSPGNQNSPYNVLGQNGTIIVKFKSIIFPTEDSAQVRIYLDSSGSFSGDKVVLMSFSFEDLTLKESERAINPLGFVVTSYQIANESLQ